MTQEEAVEFLRKVDAMRDELQKSVTFLNGASQWCESIRDEIAEYGKTDGNSLSIAIYAAQDSLHEVTDEFALADFSELEKLAYPEDKAE